MIMVKFCAVVSRIIFGGSEERTFGPTGFAELYWLIATISSALKTRGKGKFPLTTTHHKPRMRLRSAERQLQNIPTNIIKENINQILRACLELAGKLRILVIQGIITT
jgi:hypothetical protein